MMARGNWNKHHSGDICDATPDATRAGLLERSRELYAVSDGLVVALQAVCHALPTGEQFDFTTELDLAERAIQSAKDAGVMVAA